MFFRAWCGWTVCSFGQDSRFDPITIVKCDLVFQSSRNQDVTWNVPYGVGIQIGLAAREIFNGAMFLSPLIEFLDMKAVRIADNAVPFADTDNLATVFFREEFCGVITNVSESLEHHRFSVETFGQSKRFEIVLVLKSFFDAELYATASCLAASRD